MPLEILVPFVVVAVCVIMLVITRSGLSKQAHLGSAAAVAARFDIDYPGSAIDRVMIADDHRAALLIMRDDAAVGLVRAWGDRTTTRLLGPGALASVVAHDADLVVHSADFTWSRQTIALAEPADREQWRRALAPLCADTQALKVTA